MLFTNYRGYVCAPIKHIRFYTGVSSFLNNDRQQNSDFNISLFTDLTKNNYYIFSNGFYVTISLIALVALLTPKLYKHYYYKIFAIITWFLLIGSLSQYFDSAFNGFSLPQRRWVYFLVLSTNWTDCFIYSSLIRVDYETVSILQLCPYLLLVCVGIS